jgi:hypothetical protein
MMNLLILHGVEFEVKLYKKYFVQFRAILKNLPNVPVASVKVAEPIAKIEAVVEVEAVVVAEVVEVEAVVVAEVEAVEVAEVAEVEAVVVAEVAEVEAVVVAEVEAVVVAEVEAVVVAEVEAVVVAEVEAVVEAVKEQPNSKKEYKYDIDDHDSDYTDVQSSDDEDDDSDDDKDLEEVATDSDEEEEEKSVNTPFLQPNKAEIIPPIVKNKYDDVIIIDDQKKASAFIRSIVPPEVFKTQRGEDAKPVSVFVQHVIDKENEKLPKSMKGEVVRPQLKMKLK